MRLNGVGLPELCLSSYATNCADKEHDNLLKEQSQAQSYFMRCPIFQVITASWEAARGALVMMVLEMGP